MSEEWRPIPSAPGYEASSDGRIRSARATNERQIRKQSVDSTGYYQVSVVSAMHGRSRAVRVHKLVAEAFLGPRPEGLEIRHLNGDALDNRPANLRYGTRSENIADSLAHGTHVNASRTHCPRGHRYSDANNVRQAHGRRYCRPCSNAYLRIYHSMSQEERAARKLAGLPIVDLAAYFAAQAAA